MIEAGETRVFKKPGLTKFCGGDVLVIEVHDEPRVDWTDKDTCLVRQGTKKPNIMTVDKLIELTDPA